MTSPASLGTEGCSNHTRVAEFAQLSVVASAKLPQDLIRVFAYRGCGLRRKTRATIRLDAGIQHAYAAHRRRLLVDQVHEP